MSLFKNSVGRPSNETLRKRKITYIILFGVALIGICVFVYLLINVFLGGTIESEDKNAGISPRTNKFVVQKLNDNCYRIYAPTKANYWRVQLSYNNKVYKTLNNYNNNKKNEIVCLAPHSGTKKHKISVKWAGGANDKKYGLVSLWAPSGWLPNIFTGWAYKYYDYEKPKNDIDKNGKLIVKEPEGSVYEKETSVDIKISQTFMNTAYYSIIKENNINGSRSEELIHSTCKPIKKGQVINLKHNIKKYELGARYKITVYSDSKCNNELAKDWTYSYIYLTELNGVATPTNKLSKGGAGLSIKLFQTAENLRYYSILRTTGYNQSEVLTECKPIKYGTLTEEISMNNGDNGEYKAAVYSDKACRKQIGDYVVFGNFVMSNNQVTRVR